MDDGMLDRAQGCLLEQLAGDAFGSRSNRRSWYPCSSFPGKSPRHAGWESLGHYRRTAHQTTVPDSYIPALNNDWFRSRSPVIEGKMQSNPKSHCYDPTQESPLHQC